MQILYDWWKLKSNKCVVLNVEIDQADRSPVLTLSIRYLVYIGQCQFISIVPKNFFNYLQILLSGWQRCKDSYSSSILSVYTRTDNLDRLYVYTMQLRPSVFVGFLHKQ